MAMKMVANNMNVATAKILEAAKIAKIECPVQIPEGRNSLSINLSDMPRAFLEGLMSTDLNHNQRTQVAAVLGDVSEVQGQTVDGVNALHRILKTLQDPQKPTVEVLLAGRWYPVMVSNAVLNEHSTYAPKSASLSVRYRICDQTHDISTYWTDRDFIDDDGHKRVRAVGELLAEEGLRLCRPQAREAWKEREERAAKIRGRAGRVLETTGVVLKRNPYLWNRNLDTIPLGSEDRPRTLIVEHELELDRNSHYGISGGGTDHNLPFLRCFSMDLKDYVYVDVDDVRDRTFDEKAHERLVVPGGIRGILDRIFDARMEDLFGDVTRGRHGGLVVLANGTQGVGKTLTAEVFAERNRRPLYVLEMGELGTNLADVEKNLQRIFARATRWNAVLLFDEADVFLAKRADADLERSAIVGVFLRLLDRYEGLFFLTTNRADSIDPAFASRVTIKIDYPELDQEARARVWKMMFEQAGYKTDAIDDRVLEKKIDGRKIRNQVRLLGLICGKKDPTTEDVLEVLKFVS